MARGSSAKSKRWGLDAKASPARGAWLAGLALLCACGAGRIDDGAAPRVSRVEVPLQSTDSAGRVFRITGTFSLSGPESDSVLVDLADANAADDLLTFTPIVGSYTVTLAAPRVYQLDTATGGYTERPDATPTSALSQQVEVRSHASVTARFSFRVPLAGACAQPPCLDCATHNGGCDPLTTCSNVTGTISCGLCPAGYAGTGATGCVNIDECAVGTAGCDADAACTDTPGAFVCACPEGWLDVNGDGSLCQHARAVSAGTNSACAITGDGALYCWGDNASGQLGDGTRIARSLPTRVGTESDWSDVSVGQGAVCGVRSGELHCWGAPMLGGASGPLPLRVGADADWSSVELFASHACGIRAAGEVYCWGNNASGQAGIGSTLPSALSTPTRAGTLDGVVDLGLGNGGQTCAVRNTGELYCWGENGSGQLGDGTTIDRYSPTLISNMGWTAVAGGQSNTCGIAGGSLYCWGIAGYGVLGNGSTAGPAELAPRRVGSDADWTALGFGHYHVCGVRSGELYCWGGDALGQLGNGPGVQYTSIPGRVGTSSAWTDVTGNLQSTCGIDGGEVHCWGENTYGQAGTGAGPVEPSPKAISLDPSWSQVSAGYRYTCGIRGGALLCWGDSSSGKLGLGVVSGNLSRPTQVGSDTDWNLVSAGVAHTCGLRAGVLYCWGNSNGGRLGDGTLLARNVPTPVVVPVGATAAGWTHVVTGFSHTCGINEGALYCWGLNSSGQRGDLNTTNSQAVPLRIGIDSDWNGLSATMDNTCAIRGSGQLYCWGSAVAGVQYTFMPQQMPGTWDSISASTTLCGIQGGELYCWGQPILGDGSAAGTPLPLRIGVDSDWQRVSVHSYHVCGIRPSGTYCWGNNNVGQLGDGTQTTRYTPVPISAATDWSSLSLAYGGHACGTRPGIGLLCWGADSYGELGDGFETTHHLPQPSALP